MKLWPRSKWRTLDLHQEGLPLPVVADAAVAVGAVGEGRLIPLVIVDTTTRSDFEELVRIHQYTPPGDVESQWLSINGIVEHLALRLAFKRPSQITVLLNFPISEKAFLVDQILTAKALYIQPGRVGDRLITTQNAPKILAEIPSTGFREAWDEMYYRHVTKEMRKRGLNRQQAKAAASNFIREAREFGEMRFPSALSKIQKL